MTYLIPATALTLLSVVQMAGANLDYFPPQDFTQDLAAHYWSANSSLSAFGCNYCGEAFYYEPPPNDILSLPPPPMHPSYQEDPPETLSGHMTETNGHCNLCEAFSQTESIIGETSTLNFDTKLISLFVALTSAIALILFYFATTKRSKIVATINRAALFQSPTTNTRRNHDKGGPMHESLSNPGVHLADPFYLQTNRDKNLTSPIISDQVPHKKTSIPSKYWAQPGSVIGRTIRRIPNEYEVPSCRTNSTATSSAIYGDVNNINCQRFFSPYNIHTYAEVREVLDPNDHFHTSSNSSAMISESNYDNNVYNHNFVPTNGAMVASASHGSVQMSDLNSIRPTRTANYGPPNPISLNPVLQANVHHQMTQQSIYEQPPQRAQIIITSNNQGSNPTLMNYKGRIHNVI